MTKIKKDIIKANLLYTVLIFTSVIPVSLSAALFMGLDYVYCIIIASCSALLAAKSKTNKIMPAYAAFLILMYSIQTYGLSTASFAIFICGIISTVFYYLPKQFSIRQNPVTAGIMISTALTVTVMLTTHYFGIGAIGNNVKEMIASYLSLGFHPNWRGVLYGTVVMVIMITFPRKFKTFCNTVKSSFIALAVTLVLNLFLNPPSMKTAINEIGNSFSYSGNEAFAFILNPDFNISGALLCGIALFFVCNYALSENRIDKETCRLTALSNLCFGTLGGILFPYGIKNKKLIPSGIFAALLCAAVLLCSSKVIDRIPVHSLAVVMIVGAWESVKWSEIKKAFSSPVAVACFVISVFACLCLGFVYGIIVSAVLYVFYHWYEKKSKVAEVSR